jgi:organic hydroperoxide reductase OsmC/OhrA
MSEHKAKITWDGATPDYLKGRYSRKHTWEFDGGLTVEASASPTILPPSLANPECVDPEEAFVASVSSCHMLTFLFIASKHGFAIERYVDEAYGMTSKTDGGSLWVSEVNLAPQVTFGGEKQPTEEELERMHALAHEQCFIANSVKSTILVNGKDFGEGCD